MYKVFSIQLVVHSTLQLLTVSTKPLQLLTPLRTPYFPPSTPILEERTYQRTFTDSSKSPTMFSLYKVVTLEMHHSTTISQTYLPIVRVQSKTTTTRLISWLPI